jgi:hypothetical protein
MRWKLDLRKLHKASSKYRYGKAAKLRSFWAAAKRKIRDLLQYGISDLSLYHFPARRVLAIGVCAGLFALPFVVFGHYFIGVSLGALLAGAIAYYMGCRLRAECITAGLISSAVIVAFMCGLAVRGLYILPRGVVLQAAAFTVSLVCSGLIIFLCMLPFAWLCSLCGGMIVNRLWLKTDPMHRLEVTDF